MFNQGTKLLRNVIRRLIENFDVKAIVLFGSRARGDWGPWSDYDLLIIAEFKEKYLDRLKRILDLVSDIPIAIEPHPYTLDEALDMLSRGSPIIVDALDEGIVLYSTNDFDKLLRKFEELKKKGLRRTRSSIIVPK